MSTFPLKQFQKVNILLIKMRFNQRIQSKILMELRFSKAQMKISEMIQKARALKFNGHRTKWFKIKFTNNLTLLRATLLSISHMCFLKTNLISFPQILKTLLFKTSSRNKKQLLSLLTQRNKSLRQTLIELNNVLNKTNSLLLPQNKMMFNKKISMKWIRFQILTIRRLFTKEKIGIIISLFKNIKRLKMKSRRKSLKLEYRLIYSRMRMRFCSTFKSSRKIKTLCLESNKSFRQLTTQPSTPAKLAFHARFLRFPDFCLSAQAAKFVYVLTAESAKKLMILSIL